MNFKQQQDTFDTVKWYDSIRAGDDRCGTYAFCSKCRKEEEYPCARAAYRHDNNYIRIAIVRKVRKAFI
jgi:hypothetical protein